jgi:hypothetical protein
VQQNQMLNIPIDDSKLDSRLLQPSISSVDSIEYSFSYELPT